MGGETSLDFELGDLGIVVLALRRDEGKLRLETDDGVADVCFLLCQSRGNRLGRLELAREMSSISGGLMGLVVENGEAEGEAAGVTEVLGSHSQALCALWRSEGGGGRDVGEDLCLFVESVEREPIVAHVVGIRSRSR